MKTLTLLRHAKSGWDDPITRDFDRPLNARGRKAARTVGLEMKAQGLGFDLVLASPARRVVETLEEVEIGFGPLQPRYDERLYLAATATLLEIVRGAPEEAGQLLLVGHNPGMENLALALSGQSADRFRDEIAVKYPTGTLVGIELPIDRWADAAEGKGRIARLIRPRDLDPELGPED